MIYNETARGYKFQKDLNQSLNIAHYDAMLHSVSYHSSQKLMLELQQNKNKNKTNNLLAFT